MRFGAPTWSRTGPAGPPGQLGWLALSGWPGWRPGWPGVAARSKNSAPLAPITAGGLFHKGSVIERFRDRNVPWWKSTGVEFRRFAITGFPGTGQQHFEIHRVIFQKAFPALQFPEYILFESFLPLKFSSTEIFFHFHS